MTVWHLLCLMTVTITIMLPMTAQLHSWMSCQQHPTSQPTPIPNSMVAPSSLPVAAVVGAGMYADQLGMGEMKDAPSHASAVVKQVIMPLHALDPSEMPNDVWHQLSVGLLKGPP